MFHHCFIALEVFEILPSTGVNAAKEVQGAFAVFVFAKNLPSFHLICGRKLKPKMTSYRRKCIHFTTVVFIF